MELKKKKKEETHEIKNHLNSTENKRFRCCPATTVTNMNNAHRRVPW